MEELEAVQALIDAMEATGMDYVLVGSLASSHFGLIRTTEDADFVIRATTDQLAKLKSATQSVWQWEPQTAFDPVTGKTRHLLHLGKTRFKAELFELEQDDFDLSRMNRRVRRKARGRQRFVQTPEDIIVQKLRWYKALERSKDWNDLHPVIAAQEGKLDWPYIREWCQRLELTDLLDKALATLPGRKSTDEK